MTTARTRHVGCNPILWSPGSHETQTFEECVSSCDPSTGDALSCEIDLDQCLTSCHPPCDEPPVPPEPQPEPTDP